ncbi:MAG: hypothetical protein P4L91_19050 [Burkholderiaceae bacterium]|nr:hypothetical protein [Burkholderiaceae bacterium]
MDIVDNIARNGYYLFCICLATFCIAIRLGHARKSDKIPETIVFPVKAARGFLGNCRFVLTGKTYSGRAHDVRLVLGPECTCHRQGYSLPGN